MTSEGNQREELRSVLKRHTPRLLALSGVVGVAEGERDGTPCITVYVAEQTNTLLDQIPFELEGWPVAIRESGEFRALTGAG